MAYSFNIIIHRDKTAVLKRVESLIKENGGEFEGTAECGVFQGRTAAGMIKGEYCFVADNEIKITITDKPFIVPSGVIETGIKSYFG